MGSIKLHHPLCFVLFGSAPQNAMCSFLFWTLSLYIPLWEGKVQVKCIYSSSPPLGFLISNYEVDGELIIDKVTLQLHCQCLDVYHPYPPCPLASEKRATIARMSEFHPVAGVWLLLRQRLWKQRRYVYCSSCIKTILYIRFFEEKK